MRYENVCIEGLGYVIPPHTVTTTWLEEQIAPVYQALKIPKGYIERLTGIRERHWWDEGTRVSDASAQAGERALANTGIDRKEIQCLINASVCRDYIEPATAAIVHHNLGLPPTAMSFDVVNACLGFLNGMVIIANMIELGQIDTGMVVAAEMPREGQLATIKNLLENRPDKESLRDNLASFTLGGASVAMILRHRERSRTGKRLLGGYTYSDTSHNDLCVAQTTWMKTDSTRLLREGTKVIANAWKGFQEIMGWTNKTVNKIFSHQVSEPQRQVGLRALGLPDTMDYPTVSILGNTASVAAPISMAMGIESSFVKDGDKVVLFGVGSGINSIILGIQW
ncbi:MAG: 3-oxoacyl-ACP synthase III [Anaerolineae bacterium]|jgi:3-oxoacyl-[acyl-carrier-protein] synthase-3|nr:3-oxoacyl-ACP synthase III [Anaerolineae bacterium]